MLPRVAFSQSQTVSKIRGLLTHVMPEAEISSWLAELVDGRYRPHEGAVV